MSQTELEGYSLSPQQARAWRFQQSSPSFCAQCAVLLEGKVYENDLRYALSEAVLRNEILRTTFRTTTGLELPLQVISDTSDFAWRQIDGLDWFTSSRTATLPDIDRVLREERVEPFDFRNGPLLRASLVRLGAESHVLVFTIPAVCADAWTLGQLGCLVLGFSEREGYAGEGRPELFPIQYADFAEWQNELLQESDAERGMEYWRLIGGEPQPTSLPVERISIAQSGVQFDSIGWTIDPAVAREVMQIASDRSTGPSVLLLACWQTLIWRMTESKEVVVGWTNHARESAELEISLGPFSRVLPIKCHFENLRFSEVLHQIDEAVGEAVAWQEYLDLQRMLQSGEGASGYLPIGFEYYEWPALPCSGTLTVSLLASRVNLEPHKLKLSLVCCDNELRAALEYDSALFNPADVNSIRRRFTALLRSTVADIDGFASRLKLLDDAERDQLLVDFAPDDNHCSRGFSIHGLFEGWVGRACDAVAAVCGEKHVSYAALNRLANQCSHRLKRFGAGPETVVALLLNRGPEMVLAILAVLKAGASYVVLDPEYPKKRLNSLIEDTGSRLALTSEALLEKLDGYHGTALCFDRDRGQLDAEPGWGLESAIT
ncbi:MAG: condensation domain-containing protein, partial [Blastocatellia bacterium]